MHLTHPFTRLPLRCDAERLQREAAQLTEQDWRAHPSNFMGNSAALLITVDGDENDELGHAGQFRPTPLLARLPYTRAVMRALDAPLSRSRFMRVAPRATVPRHNDVGWHWFRRVRVHVPVVTHPGVVFQCADQRVHMAEGDLWIFDNFCDHSVENDSDVSRIHLVIDVVPSPAFWRLVERGHHPPTLGPRCDERTVIETTSAEEPPLPIEPHAPRGFSLTELGAVVSDISFDVQAMAPSRQRDLAERALWQFRAEVSGNDDYQACRAAAKRLCRVLLPLYRGAHLGKTPGADMLAVLCSLGFAQDRPTVLQRIKRYAAARLRGARAGAPP